MDLSHVLTLAGGTIGGALLAWALVYFWLGSDSAKWVGRVLLVVGGLVYIGAVLAAFRVIP